MKIINKIDEIMVMIDGIEPRLYIWLVDNLDQLRPYVELAELICTTKVCYDKYHTGLGIYLNQELEQKIAKLMLKIKEQK